MNETLEPLDPELSELFAIERQAPAMPAAAQSRVWGQLALALPASLPAHAASTQPSTAHALRHLALGKGATAVVAFALGGGAGAVVQHRVEQRRAPMVSGVAAVSAAPTPPVPVVLPPVPAPPPIAAAPTAPAPAKAVVHHPPAAPSVPPSVPLAAAPVAEGPDALAAERNTLDTARTALGRGDADGALALLARYAEAHPRGALVEEADALRIQAWIAAGDEPKARAAAADFARKYPKSLMLPAIERNLLPQ